MISVTMNLAIYKFVLRSVTPLNWNQPEARKAASIISTGKIAPTTIICSHLLASKEPIIS